MCKNNALHLVGSNSGDTLQIVLRMVYIDDVLVASKTFDEHLQHLCEVFLRLAMYSESLRNVVSCARRFPFSVTLFT